MIYVIHMPRFWNLNSSVKMFGDVKMAFVGTYFNDKVLDRPTYHRSINMFGTS